MPKQESLSTASPTQPLVNQIPPSTSTIASTTTQPTCASTETSQPKRRRSAKHNRILKYYSNPIPEHLPFIPLILPLQEE